MANDSIRRGRLLIVDDQEPNVRFLERILDHAGATDYKSTMDPRQVIPLFRTYQPDLIVLDLNMPYLDGFQVLERLQPLIPAGTYLPVLVITADMAPEVKRRALAAGARDFLTKPVDPIEVILRINNLLETRFLHRQLEQQNQILEAKVQARTCELREAHGETLARLALAAEYRDDATGEHIQRVGDAAGRLAAALGLDADEVALIRAAAPLHDVGKIGISDQILLKPGKLTPAEFEVMKMHTVIGGRILDGGHSPFLIAAQQIALTHHERWDGAGYPHGLAGPTIPLAGRIVAVVDVFDALTHARPYKPAWPVTDALAEILRNRGRQFDPAVVDAFCSLHPLSGVALSLPAYA